MSVHKQVQGPTPKFATREGGRMVNTERNINRQTEVSFFWQMDSAQSNHYKLTLIYQSYVTQGLGATQGGCQ